MIDTRKINANDTSVINYSILPCMLFIRSNIKYSSIFTQPNDLIDIRSILSPACHAVSRYGTLPTRTPLREAPTGDMRRKRPPTGITFS